MSPLCLPDACQAPPRLVARLWTLRVFSMCGCSPLSQGECGVGVPYWGKMRHLLLLLSPGEIPCPTQCFCIQGVPENFGQPLVVREKEEARTWPKVFVLAVYSLSHRTSCEGEALFCDLPCYWIACSEYFLFVWLFQFSQGAPTLICGQNKHKTLGNSWWLCLFLYVSYMK